MASKTHSPTEKHPDRWVIYYRDPVSRKRSSTVFYGTASAANRECRRYEASLEFRKATHPYATLSKSLEDAAQEFLDMRVKTITHGTYKHDYRSIKRLVRAMRAGSPVSAVRMEIFEQIKIEMLTDKYAIAGINIVLRHLKHFLFWCKDKEYIDRIPKIVMLKEPEREIVWHSKAEIKKIIQNCDQDIIKDLIHLYVLTGARTMELLGAKNGTYSKKERRIIVPSSNSKTGKIRYLYINKEALQILNKYLDKSRPSQTIFDVSKDSFYNRYKKACKAAKIKSTPHALRRTSGAWLIMAGVDIYRVSKWLGHSSVVVTEKYYVDLRPSDHHKSSNILTIM